MKKKPMTALMGKAKELLGGNIGIIVPLCLSAFVPSYSQDYNYVENTTYGINDAGDKISSRSYTDGLGRALQSLQTVTAISGTGSTQIKIEKSVVSGTYYDDAGRPIKNVKPFSYVQSDRLGFITEDLITGSNCAKDFYGDDHPYSETKYYDDPLNRVQATAASGLAFSFDVPDARPDSVWHFGVTCSDAGQLPDDFPYTYLGSDGFIFAGQLSAPDNLNTNIPTALSNMNEGELHYYLTVTKDPNGHYSQTLTDLFGKTIRTWSSADGTNPIVSRYDYDILGQTISETPPPTGSQTVNSTSYVYNTLGQLESKTTPDAFTVSYEYDDAGRLHRTTDANSLAAGRSLQYDYDDLGRTVTIAQVDNTYFNTRVRNIYDDPEAVRDFVNNSTTSIAFDQYLNGAANTEGRLVATIAYDRNFWAKAADNTGSIPAECGSPNKVVELYSYDNEGRLYCKYTSIPGIAPCKVTYYFYDFQGKIQETLNYDAYSQGETFNGWRNEFYYDANGRLARIDLNDEPFVQYTYDDLGKMTKKEFVNRAGVIMPENYAYNIRDWVNSINVNNGTLFLFKEDLVYNGASHPQYNGNIARATCYFPTLTDLPYGLNGKVDLDYTYDNMSRLTQVNSIFAELKSNYSYLDDGRINTKKEGDAAHQAWDAYDYHPGTNQLKGIANSGAKEGLNYIYDPNGNMVLDRSKNMAIEYDWRDMPIAFYIFPSAIDGTVHSWEGVAHIIEYGGWTKQVVMTYDASGTRVKKETFERDVCTLPNPQSAALLVTNKNSGKSVVFNPDGSMKSCLPLQDLGANPDAVNSLIIEKAGTTLLNISDQAVASKGAMVGNNTNTATMGDLVINYSNQSTKQNIIDQNGGYIGIAGDLPMPAPETGVAYTHDQVLTYNQTNGDYEHSYTNIGSEGHALADGSREYFVKDHLGSTRAVLTEDWILQEAIDYLPYGTQIQRVTPPGELAREKFTGKELDKEGGTVNGGLGIQLSYFGARYYDAEVGLFASTDPAGEFYNAYRYTTNPVGFVDPTGMTEWTPAFSFSDKSYYQQSLTTPTNYSRKFLPSLAMDMGGALYSGWAGTVNLAYNVLTPTIGPWVNLLGQGLEKVMSPSDWANTGVMLNSIPTAPTKLAAGYLFNRFAGVAPAVEDASMVANAGKVGLADVSAAKSAAAPISKFSDYIFKEGATHGKNTVFEELGYAKGNSAELAALYEQQAASKFAQGAYTFGKVDQYGQRINIGIELPGIGNAAGKTSYLNSGWMLRADGTITLNTPFSGFVR